MIEGLEATGPTESLELEAHARETAVLMLRRTLTGIDRADFAQRTGFDLDALAGPTLKKFVDRGLLEEVDNRVRFTRDGLFLADSVLCELV